MKFFVFIILIPLLTGFITALLGFGWFDELAGISLNVICVLLSNIIYWGTE